MSITLVGVTHRVGRTMAESKLMGDTSEKLFAETIVPRITDRSILFSEGAFRANIRPDQREYEDQLRGISASLASSGKRPVLGFSDPRSLLGPKGIQEMVSDTLLVLDFFTGAVRYLDKPPKTLAAAVEFVVAARDSVKFELRREPSQQVRTAMRRLAGYNEKFDELHIRKLEASSKEFEHGYLVAGLAHCLSIHLKTGWDLEVLDNEQNSDPRDVVRGYYNVYVFPRLILQI